MQKTVKENGKTIYEDGYEEIPGRWRLTIDAIHELLSDEWRYKMRPDGHKICRLCNIFHAYEVVDHHRMSDDRLADYYDLFDYLGEHGMDGILHVFDRHGSERIWTTGDLMEAAIRVESKTGIARKN